jgi:membrane protease YdiL (CAAX protease family)
MKSKIKFALYAGLPIILWYGIQYIVAAAIYLPLLPFALFSDNYEQIYESFMAAVDSSFDIILFFMMMLTLSVMAFLYLRYDRKRFTLEPVKAKDCFFAVLLGISAVFAAGVLMRVMLVIIGMADFGAAEALVAGYNEEMQPYYYNAFLEFADLVILTPIVEELCFRGLIYNRLRTRLNVRASVLISSLIFAAAHWDILQGAYAFVSAAVIALIYEKTHSLVIPIIEHMTFNFIGGGYMGLIFVQDGFSSFLVNAFSIVGFALCAMYFIKWRKKTETILL